MGSRKKIKKKFYVVEFIEKPFEHIDEYVSVPCSWIVVDINYEKAVVAYPKDEDPSCTRKRAERKEKYFDNWKFYVAFVKYRSDTYNDAEYWITRRKNFRIIQHEYLKEVGMQLERTSEKDIRISPNHSSKPKKDEPVLTNKRYNNDVLESHKQPNKKRLKTDNDAKSHSTDVSRGNMQPECQHKRQVLKTSLKDDQLIDKKQIGGTIGQSPLSNTADGTKAEPIPPNITEQTFQSVRNHFRKLLLFNNTLVSNYQPEITGIAIGTKKLPNGPILSFGKSHDLTAVRQNVTHQAVAYDTLASLHRLSLPHQQSSFLQLSKGQQNLPTQGDYLEPATSRNEIQPSESQRIIQKDISNIILQKSKASAAQYQHYCINIPSTDYMPSIEENSMKIPDHLYPISKLPQEIQLQSPNQLLQSSLSGNITKKNNNHFTITAASQNITSGSSGNLHSDGQVPNTQLTSLLENVYQNSRTQKKLNKSTQTNMTTKQVRYKDDITNSSATEYTPRNVDSACQTDEHLVGETRSPGTYLDSDLEVTSDHEMSVEEALVQTVQRNQNFTENNSAENSTAGNSKIVLMQQMLDEFASIFTQMGASMALANNMHNYLRTSMLKISKAYKKLL